MKNCISILACMLILFLTSCTQPQNKPNILFILADDFGYHDMGNTGSKFYETPHLDKLSKESLNFTQGYAACQVCSPSRASIMTGKFPARHGITEWIGQLSGEEWRRRKRHTKMLPAHYKHVLDHSYTTLPEALQLNGYKTFFAGKWHIGSEGSHPEDHGFDINVGGFHSGSPKGGFFSPYKNPKMKDGPEGENLTMRLAKETANFIKEHKDSTFMAFLSFYAVHSPIQTTEELWNKYRDKAESQGLADSGYVMERRLPIRQVQDNPIYAGLVESMDAAIGHVLNQLEELGLDDNTIVVFTSDNGGVSSGDNFSTSNLPLRGGKGYQWEGGIREPYFIKVPWSDQMGKTCDIPVSGVDFYPTLLDLAGLELKPEEHQDGISLAPFFNGNFEANERPLIWHYPHYSNQGGDPSSIIRRGKWKLIYYWETDNVELYNLDKDPYEKDDVSKANTTIANDLSQELKNFLAEVNANKPAPDELYSAELDQKRMEFIRTKKLQQLENDRVKFLTKGWEPNKNWWGSKVTED